ncbi:GtrA-like protein [Legionella sainthelensi]|uniref:GtrA family protein n=1 Tax=Legionella sainthelensi TaxID=28087 RepID=UPI000F6FC634|nr:GtrA family protein [Legionella sainthelensi]VEB38815.1 GtrA-like protein [Legionella sainthelensi]
MIKRELGLFLIVGILTVFVDFLSYRGLSELMLMDIDIAKAAGFLIGTLLAYFANRLWTFGHKSHKPGSTWRFIVLYTSTLLVNVLINSLTLKLLDDGVTSIQLAFLVATGFSATLNFLGMKFFVFRPGIISAVEV